MIGDLSFLKGNIQPIILNSLYNGDKYGYEIAREIKEKTENSYEIKQPTLYSYLKKLEKDSLIESYWGAESNGGRRRYYRLTSVGRATFEQYTSQWNMQKSVMEALVDTQPESSSPTQIDTALLLGTKEKRSRKKREVSQEDIDSQADIAYKLASITSSTAEPNEIVSEKSNGIEHPLDQLLKHSSAQSVNDISQATNIAETNRAKFDLHQESVETFMQNFDEQANKLINNKVASRISDDYKSTLFDIIGNQLDDVDTAVATSNYKPAHMGSSPSLVDVADTFAKSGIRMRIYNSNTAIYHSKKLMPFSKIICTTSWISYAVLALCLGILALTTLSLGIITKLLVASIVALILPVAGTIAMVVDPTRKVAKKLNYRIIYSICIVGWLAFVAMLFAINTLFLGLKFDDIGRLIISIIVPAIFALLPLCAFVTYNKLSSQYVN